MRNILGRICGILILAGLVGLFVAAFVLPAYMIEQILPDVSGWKAGLLVIGGWLICLGIAWGVFEWLDEQVWW